MALESVKPSLEGRKQALTVHITPEPVSVNGDAARLTQVLVNLLTNAAKYTPPGGHVAVHLERHEGMAQLRVEDNGIGMTEALRERVFDPFGAGPGRAGAGEPRDAAGPGDAEPTRRTPSRGKRPLTLTRSVWVERSDVRAEAEEGFWRLYSGNWVRLKNGLNVLVHRVERDEAGSISRVVAEADLGSVNMKEARHKAKATLHWLGTEDAERVSVAHYGPLFDADGEFDDGCVRHVGGWVERGLSASTHFEFERVGYFWVDADGGLHHRARLKGSSPKRSALG